MTDVDTSPDTSSTSSGESGSASRRARFYPLTVSAVRPLTDKAIEVTFAVPEDLAGEFDYVSGQYVALRTELNGAEVRRSYSLCASPNPGEIKIAIKRDLSLIHI